MKKFLLSFFVILAFAFYVIFERRNADNKPASIPFFDNLFTGEGKFKDGNYTGPVTDAFYGPFQVRAIITNQKLSDIEFLQYPNDRPNSTEINERAMPFMEAEAIRSQSADVDIISGATQSTEAFILSLRSALDQAK